MKTGTIALVLLLACVPIATAQDFSKLEEQIVTQLNASRRQAGLQPLSVERRLGEAARAHSQLMAEQSKLAHVLPGEAEVADRLAATGLHYNRSGENVGYNSDPDGLHAAFMKSPPHRENILNPYYTQVGIGVVRDEDGIYWATEDFTQTLVQRSADQTEDSVASAVERLRASLHKPSLERIDSSKLRDLACSMSATRKMDPRQVLAQPGVHQAITYTNTRPEELPASARQAASSSANTRYAVGACFASDANNPGGTYFVVMAFY